LRLSRSCGTTTISSSAHSYLEAGKGRWDPLLPLYLGELEASHGHTAFPLALVYGHIDEPSFRQFVSDLRIVCILVDLVDAAIENEDLLVDSRQLAV